MEARNLRKERTGVVVSNKMVSSFLKRKNTMLMMKRMNVM